MNRWKSCLAVLLASLCLTSYTYTADAAGITSYSGLITPVYWTKQAPQGDEVILDEAGIKAYNERIRQASRTVVDLSKYPSTLTGDAVKSKIMNYQVLDDDLYLHGNKVSENYKNILRQQTNLKGVPNKVTVKYGVLVRRSNVRTLPTGEGLYYYAGDTDFDALQETALDPGDAVAILHQSTNGFFYFVQAVNYTGWISKFDIAITDKNTWMGYVKPDKFLVVTDANLTVKTNAEQVVYQQGSRLPILSKQGSYYTVQAPVRKPDGNLQKLKVTVAQSAGVHEGYMPYTSNNIVSAAFKFYNMPYGWGGLKNSVDCSSLMYNAYRTVGIYLPRNADEQEMTSGTTYDMGSVSNRTATINGLTPGSGLYMDGHVVMYIGKVNEVPYGIHALGSYFSNGQRIRPMKVVVSDLTLQRSSGETFLNDLTTAVEFK